MPTLADQGLIQGTPISNQPNQAAPGPVSVDQGAAMDAWLKGMTPERLNQLIGLEQQFGSQFRDLGNASLGNAQGAINGYWGQNVQQSQNLINQLQAQQNAFNSGQFDQNAAWMTNSYVKSNPWLDSAMSRSDALGGQYQNAGLNALQGQLLGGAPQAQNVSAMPVNAQQMTSGGQLGFMSVSPERIAAERAAAERVSAGQVGTSNAVGGDLGNALYQQALQAQQQSPLSAALSQQGMNLATNPGQLSQSELRAATQGSRAGYAATGRIGDNTAITGEALARAGASRDRYMQDIGAAQGINQQLLGAQQMGQSLATDVLKTDIQRQQFNIQNQLGANQFNVQTGLQAGMANQQTGLQASLANQDASLRASMANQQNNYQTQFANQQAGMDANKFNILNSQDVQRSNQAANLQAGMFNSTQGVATQDANRAFANQQQQQYYQNLQNLGMLGMQQNEANRAYNLGQVGAYSGITNQALAANQWGQQATGVNAGTNLLGMAMQQNQAPLATVFDPNSATNLALQNAANLNNYNSNVYGANTAYYGAKAGADASKGAGLLGGIGSVVGGALAGPAGTAIAGLFKCWVAREVYGVNNPQWLMFRAWLEEDAPKWFHDLYVKHGESFARFIHNKPLLKKAIKAWMDSRINAKFGTLYAHV